MERFSISILRQQVYNICRLCGVDNPDKTLILGDEDVVCVMETEEPTLVKKIEECVGIQVHANDQMPQSICSLCVDKVNDFYEYRLMCASTNIQTRTFLNLPLVQPCISLMKAEPELALPADPQDDKSLATISTQQKHGPKTRNRKKQLGGTEEPENSAEDTDFKSFPDAPSEKRTRYEHSCQYCTEKYDQPTDLERHLIVKHTPLVHKFGCGSCMEYFDTASEYKDHNLWHKLTRTAFGCFRCGKKCAKIGTLNKHVEMNVCLKRPRGSSADVKLVPDMRCAVCQKVFKTRNLYEWHGCFMRARANCPRCGKYFLKKNLLTRHFMLYCTGSLPLMEPTYMWKNEPGVGPADGVPPQNLPGGSMVPPKRGRGRPARASETMKEETLDLPLPPLLDLPDFKLESNTTDYGQNSSEGTLSCEEANKVAKESSLIEQTDKITTLLRSGASVDGNTDIATINSMLSSVNEAIATISKVRKKIKKRDRGGHDVEDEGTEKANPPMVVLSMANVKHEVPDDSSGFVPNATAPISDNHDDAGHDDGGSEAGDNDMVEDSFADRNDSDGDSSDVEIISVENYHPTGASNASTNGPLLQQMLQIKQEPMATDDGDESDFEGYEDASMFAAVKQEPLDEPVAADSNQPCDTMGKHSDPLVSSSYQALRIKIKKEKGLLNASMVEDGTIDPIQTPEVDRQKAPAAAVGTGSKGTSGMKAAKPTAKRNNLPTPAKRHRPASPKRMMVAIKQEPMESHEQLQENVTTEQYCTTDTTTTATTTTTFTEPPMVRIKQEPLDDNTRPPCSSGASSMHANNERPETSSPADVVAFDGMRIKQERADNEPAQQKSKKAFNPLSLSGIRLAGSKKSANSSSLPRQSLAHKSSIMINPFALFKQKESLPTVEEHASSSKEGDSSVGGRPEQFGLPVIAQVKSIDPVEHLSLTSVPTAEAVPSSSAVEQPQTDNCDYTDNRRNTDSTPATELNCGISASAANVVPPEINVCELKITSVTSITEDVYGCNSHQQQPLCEEQQESIEATNNSDDNAGQVAVSQLDEVSDELAGKDLLPTLDSQADETPNVEEDPKPVNTEAESQKDSAASLSAEQTLEDSAEVRMEDERQERNCLHSVAADSVPSIDTTAVSNTVYTLTTTEDEREDVNINASATTKEDDLIADGTIAAENHVEPPPGPCAVAGNDGVLVATQQCTS